MNSAGRGDIAGEAAGARRLVAIVHADIAGYGRHIGRDDSGTLERVPSQDLRSAEALSAFFIVPARAKKSLLNLFADHPPLEQRLAALERLESQLQSAA